LPLKGTQRLARLYDLIANDSEQAITVGEAFYRFQFKGMQYGSSNWLEVTAERGVEEMGVGLEQRNLLALPH